jgi:hypothetical protein
MSLQVGPIRGHIQIRRYSKGRILRCLIHCACPTQVFSEKMSIILNHFRTVVDEMKRNLANLGQNIGADGYSHHRPRSRSPSQLSPAP